MKEKYFLKMEGRKQFGMEVYKKVFLQKCKSGKLFGVKIEKQNGDWLRTWAFEILEISSGEF